MNEILHQAQRFREIVAELKRESSYYPSILIKYYERHVSRKNPEREQQNTIINKLAVILLKKPEQKIDKDCYASTLVRIERNGKWYVVHCVESISPTKKISEQHLLLKIMDSVYKIQLLYQIATIPNTAPLQDIDTLQQSEIERLTENITNQKT